MSEATFTPGPWEVSLAPNQWLVVAGDLAVAEVFPDNPGSSELPWEANARLIAAAPTMYAALDRVRDHKSLLPEWLVDAVYAALAAAVEAE